jgi:hypothetical protein
MKIPAGTTCYIGPPAKPIPKQISHAVGAALGKIPEILEAHLPMVYIEGQIDPPAQVLVVVLEKNRPSPQARISEALRLALPTNSYMDTTELHPGDPQLPTIRPTATQLESQAEFSNCDSCIRQANRKPNYPDQRRPTAEVAMAGTGFPYAPASRCD